MFEVGKKYSVVTLEGGRDDEGRWGTFETTSVYEVVSVEGTLVKFLEPEWVKSGKFDDLLADFDESRSRRELIINTAGLFFVHAEKLSDKQE